MRSENRHQLEKRKKKWRRIILHQWHWAELLASGFFDKVNIDRIVGLRAQAPNPCSDCCGNPRRHGYAKKTESMTMQEKRQAHRDRDDGLTEKGR